MTVIALIPAHNEENGICEAVIAVRKQYVDRIVVICDNCTDRTAQLAASAGAEVIHTVNNTAKKAGALNQALNQLLHTLDDDDGVLVQDADSVLDPGFLRIARAKLVTNSTLGGVGGTFRGGPGGGLVGMFQRNEYARYARDVDRLNGKVLVLTGTATLFRAKALKDVVEARHAKRIPYADGVYDETVLTEDNEVSQALMHIGWKILSPRGCTLETEVMPTWRDLYQQRLRWKRGAVENLFQYGVTKITWRYWGRQFMTALGCLVTIGYIASVVASVFLGGIHLHLLWLLVSAVFSVERAVTVRSRGWKHMLLGATILWEFPYDVFLQMVHVVAYTQIVLRTGRKW